MKLLVAVLGAALALGSCTMPPRRAEAVTVLLARIPLREEQDRTRVELDTWLTRGLRTPGASFVVLQAGSDRRSATTIFSAVVPASWGAPNAVANRERFAATARRELAQAFSGGRTAPSTVARGTSSRLVTLPELDSRGVRWTWITPATPVHDAILCDVSPSAAGVSCTSASLLHAFDAWAPRALTPGATLRGWIVGTSVSTATCVFAVETPDLPIAERAAYLLGARQELARALDHVPPHAGSAVAEALTVAVTDLAGRGGAKELRVLSDLRQSSGPWTFDRAVPSPREFARWLAAERLLPNCTGITVSICGLHFGETPNYLPFTAREAALVRDVWTNAFAAMHAQVVGMCSECDANAFRMGETDMARQPNKHGKQAAQIGTNRGGRAFVEAAPLDTADVIREWALIDPKPGRSAALAARIEARFPTIRTIPREADGRQALAELDDDAVIIATVDTVEATRALVSTRRPRQALCFQVLGRGPGPAVTATRLGLSGVVQDDATAAEAGLLLDGFATISEAASSRALTAAGDPMSAGLLGPLRLTTTRATARAFREVVHEEVRMTPPLTFFTASGAYPLVVRSMTDHAFAMQRAAALDAVAHLQTHRVGIIAAVALVDLEERAVDVFFIDRSRDDRRRVDGIVPFRAPAQRFTAPAIFTD
jgi:hypothetical protein